MGKRESLHCVVWIGLWKVWGFLGKLFVGLNSGFLFWGIGFLVAFSASSSFLPLVLLEAERMLNR